MSETRHSEKISEKPARRGRPRLMSRESEATLRGTGLFEEDQTRRTHLNKWWYLNGLKLWDHYEPAFGWLLDTRDSIQAGTGKIRRKTILAELGRIEDEESMIAVARELCATKPTTRRAVAMIRRYRLGREPEASAIDLTGVILKAIGDYVETRPTTIRQVLAALENAKDAYEEPQCDPE